jgi:hypothetical protein
MARMGRDGKGWVNPGRERKHASYVGSALKRYCVIRYAPRNVS